MDIAIIGMGLAGLRTASLLAAAGLRPRCFDAAPRLGGRITTVFDPAGRPQFEAGAEWIDGDHARMIDLVARTGLHLVMSNGPALQFLADPMAEAEAARVESEALARAQTGERPPGDVAGFLRREARSTAAAALLTARYRSDEGEDLTRIGLAGWFVGLRQYQDRSGGEASSLRVAEGLSTLCERLAAGLPEPPCLGRRLVGLTQDGVGVDLRFADGEHVRTDRVVLALPIETLQRLDLPLPEPQRRAFAGLAGGRSCKLMLRFRRPFWRGAGWGRSVLFDSPLQELWDATLGGAPTLCAYVVGDAAARLAGSPDPGALALRELSRRFACASEEFVGGELHAWLGGDHPGPHAFIPPDYDCDLLPWRGRPWGRVHFAGEHTATWLGFMEGALESAETVVGQILASPRPCAP